MIRLQAFGASRGEANCAELLDNSREKRWRHSKVKEDVPWQIPGLLRIGNLGGEMLEGLNRLEVALNVIATLGKIVPLLIVHRPAHPQPLPGRPGEVHRLRAVRVGLYPADAIFVEGGDNTDAERFSPGKRCAADQINYARCIFCGLCIEACPTRSLTMSNEYELARDNRQDLIFTKEQLLAPLLPGMEQPPHPMRLGDTEKDYYLGAPANPGTSAEGAETR